ncbi:hypothetical protein EYZ11_010369 [Aspergillus tanneri]|uniref:Uncharacterized protein n=1 Tax=Aspergillus tanneri TaxID=1220188 RepID=A0A4V3UN81_9EURO|nr:hypothetical protein EYZ11_010369 [Aspergillus tanneri]
MSANQAGEKDPKYLVYKAFRPMGLQMRTALFFDVRSNGTALDDLAERKTLLEEIPQLQTFVRRTYQNHGNCVDLRILDKTISAASQSPKTTH